MCLVRIVCWSSLVLLCPLAPHVGQDCIGVVAGHRPVTIPRKLSEKRHAMDAVHVWRHTVLRFLEKDEGDSCREELKYQEAQACIPLECPVSAADFTGQKLSWGGSCTVDLSLLPDTSTSAPAVWHPHTVRPPM